MATKFEKVVQTVNDGLELFGDYLAGKLTALYKVGVEKGKTEFGFLGDKSIFEFKPNRTEEDDRIFEESDEILQKWQGVFAVINDEYVEMSKVVSGVTYVLEEKAIWVKRYQESWEGEITGDEWFRVYPHSVENHRPLVKLMKLIAEELEVDLDEI